MRIEKVNSLMQRELSTILLEDFDFAQGTLVTILEVETADNLETAKVWVSVLPESMTGTTMAELRSKVGDIQKRLNRKLELHFVPRILFKLDASERYAAHIDEVMRKEV